MATSVGLNFRLTAAVENFEKSMADVNRKLGQIDKSSRSTASGMKLLAGIEVGKLLVGGLTKVAGLARSAASSALALAADAAATSDAIGKLATSTGMAIPELQVFSQMAAYGGVSSTQFGDALQKMSRGLGEAANGTGTAKRGLEQLGLSVDDLLKMSPSQQFLKIAAAIDGIEDPAKRSAIAADIFGRSGTKLIPMFENIEDNARKTTGEMESLAQVLSTEQVRNIEAMNDSFDTVKKTVIGVVAQVVGHLAPAVVEANNKLLEFVKNFQFKGATGGQAFVGFVTEAFIKAAKILADWADAFILALTKAFDQIGRIFDRLSDFLAKYLGMDRYASGGANEADQRILAIDAELANYERLIKNQNFALDQQMTSQDQHDKRVAEFRKKQELLWSQRSDAEKQIVQAEQAYYEKKKSSVTGMTSIREAVDKIADGLSTKITPAIDTVPSRLKLMTQAFEKVEASIKKTPEVVGKLEKAMPKAVSSVFDFSKKVVDSVSGFATTVTDKAYAARDFYNSLSGLVDKGAMTGNELARLASRAAGTGAGADEAKDALYRLRNAADNAKDFRTQIFNKHMQAWDQKATMVRDRLISNGMNAFDANYLMMQARAKEIETVNGQLDALESKHLKKVAALEENTGKAAKHIGDAGEKIGKKMNDAGKSLLDYGKSLIGGAKNWWEDFIGSGDDAAESIPDPIPELEKQTAALGDMTSAIRGLEPPQPVVIG